MTPALIRYIAPHLAALVLISTSPAVTLAQEQPKPKLQILIIGGEGSINNIKQRTAREPVVEVDDENNRPVAGAVVLFKAPDFGPSGTFPNGSNVLSVTTDQQGRAAAQGFRPNAIEGNLEMQVTASFADISASTVIHMRNSWAGGGGGGAKAGGGSGKIIAIIAVVGAAAGAGAAFGLRGGNKTSPAGPAASPAATTISLGTGTVGPRP